MGCRRIERCLPAENINAERRIGYSPRSCTLYPTTTLAPTTVRQFWSACSWQLAFSTPPPPRKAKRTSSINHQTISTTAVKNYRRRSINRAVSDQWRKEFTHLASLALLLASSSRLGLRLRSRCLPRPCSRPLVLAGGEGDRDFDRVALFEPFLLFSYKLQAKNVQYTIRYNIIDNSVIGRTLLRTRRGANPRLVADVLDYVIRPTSILHTSYDIT